MATATHKTEFLINGVWRLHSESPVVVDTFDNLVRRQGSVDLPHLKREFKGNQKIETREIVALGERFWVRDTLTWAEVA